MSKGYTDLLINSADMPAIDVYEELRKLQPRNRTHYGLLKQYIQDKHDMYYYELQLRGMKNVSELSMGYLLAFKEMCALIDACEYNLRCTVKMEKGD